MSGGLFTRRVRADLTLTLVAFIWGSTFIVVKEALGDISVVLFLTIRFALATFALVAVFRMRAALPSLSDRNSMIGGFLAGACLFSGYVLQTFGLRHTSAAKTGFLTGLYIVLVPLLGAIVYKTAPRLSEVMGVALAAAGLAFLTLPAGQFEIGQGDWLVTASTVPFAAQILVLGRWARRVRFVSLSVHQLATCAILGAATFWWLEAPRAVWSTKVVVALAVTSLLATALAFTAQSWAQQFTTETRTALILALEPLFAWLASYLLAGELLSKRGIFGAGLILGGILLVELKPAALARHPSP